MSLFRMLRGNRTFALYWLAQSISQIGNAFHQLALPLWIYSLTGSPLSTGMAFAAGTLPNLILSPIAGALVDRMNRKVLLVISDLIRGILVLTLLTVKTSDHFWYVYVVTIAMGIMTSFFGPSQMAIIQGMVERSSLPIANSLLQLSFSGAMIIGPVVGGILVKQYGFMATFTFNAISFFVGACGSLLISNKALLNNKPQVRNKRLYTDLIEGFKIIMENLAIRRVLYAQLLVFLGTGANGILIVLHMKDYGAAELGLLMSAQGVGMIFGSLYVPSVIKKLSKLWELTLVTVLIMGLSITLFIQFTPQFLYVGMLWIAIFGFVLTSFNVATNTHLQSVTASESMGRVAGVSRFVITSAVAISTLIGSSVTFWITPRSVISIGGGLLFVFSILLWLFQRKSASIGVVKAQ